MPGFLQLQAGLLDPALGGSTAPRPGRRSPTHDLRAARSEHNWWHRSAGAAADALYDWGVPPQAVLDQARRAAPAPGRAGAAALPRRSPTSVLLVVGQAPASRPTASRSATKASIYLDAQRRRRRPRRRSPALLPGVRTWSAGLRARRAARPRRCASRPTSSCSTAATTGAPAAAGPTWRRPAAARRRAARRCGARAQPALARSRPSRCAGRSAERRDRRRCHRRAARAGRSTTAALPALRVTVLNGNLSFVRQPLLVGHYRSTAADRHRGGRRRPDRRRDGRPRWPPGSIPDGAGLAPDVRATPQRPRQPAGAAAPAAGDRRRPRRREASSASATWRTPCARPSSAWAQRMAEAAAGAPADASSWRRR